MRIALVHMHKFSNLLLILIHAEFKNKNKRELPCIEQ